MTTKWLLPNMTRKKGGSVLRALQYDFRSSRRCPAALVYTNLMGRSIEDLAGEFSRVAKLRKVTDPLVRISISLPGACSLPQELWIRVLRTFLAEIGIDERFPVAAVLHSEQGLEGYAGGGIDEKKTMSMSTFTCP